MILGADTAQLVQQAGHTEDSASRLDELLATTQQHGHAVDWHGPDAEEFRDRMNEGVARGVAAAARLHRHGAELRGHAEEQDSTSSVDGDGLGDPGPEDDSGRTVPSDDSPSRPAPDPLDPALQDELDSLLEEALEDGGLQDIRGNSRDLDALAERLEGLTPAERAAFVAGLSDEELDALRSAMDAEGEGWFGIDGNTDESRRALLDELLRDAHPDDVERLSDTFDSLHPDGRGGGDGTQGDFDVEPDGTVTPPGEVVPEDASWRDVDQGRYGDCVSMATIGMMMQQDPGWAADHVQDNGNGTVTVTLYDENGDPEPITMPKELPSVDGQMLGANRGSVSEDPDAPTWPAYVERALAIQMGGEYSAIEGHGSPEVGPRLTGQSVETVPPTDAEAAFDAARSGEPVIVGTAVPIPDGATPPDGWVGGHGFWVDGVGTNAAGEEVLVLRNPHGPESQTLELTREQYAQYTSSAEIHHD